MNWHSWHIVWLYSYQAVWSHRIKAWFIFQFIMSINLTSHSICIESTEKFEFKLIGSHLALVLNKLRTITWNNSRIAYHNWALFSEKGVFYQKYIYLIKTISNFIYIMLYTSFWVTNERAYIWIKFETTQHYTLYWATFHFLAWHFMIWLQLRRCFEWNNVRRDGFMYHLIVSVCPITSLRVV